jgi:hypothetical protein
MLSHLVDWLADLFKRLPEELILLIIVRWIERMLS